MTEAATAKKEVRYVGVITKLASGQLTIQYLTGSDLPFSATVPMTVKGVWDLVYTADRNPNTTAIIWINDRHRELIDIAFANPEALSYLFALYQAAFTLYEEQYPFVIYLDFEFTTDKVICFIMDKVTLEKVHEVKHQRADAALQMMMDWFMSFIIKPSLDMAAKKVYPKKSFPNAGDGMKTILDWYNRKFEDGDDGSEKGLDGISIAVDAA